MAQHPPFKSGDPRTKEYGQRGGRISAEARRIKAAADPTTRGLLGELLTYTTADWFDRLGLTEASWAGHRTFGTVFDGLPLRADELGFYTEVTGRTTLPRHLLEILALLGRGSGKTTGIGAVQAIKYAYRAYPAVRGTPRVLLLAFVKEQAGVAFELISEFLDRDRELRKLIARRTKDSITLAHGVVIQTIASNYRQVRGFAAAFAFCDELAYWWNEDTSANPDIEVLRALRPALGKVAGSRLVIATSPWTQEGAAFDMHQKYWGNNDSDHVLVLRAPTLTFNPSYDRARIAAVEADDPESAAAEFGAAWRVAGAGLVRPEVLDAAIAAGVTERPPEPPLDDDSYTAAVDLSGGTGQDSAALTIVHVEAGKEGAPDRCVQDVLREWEPPFDPGVVVGQMAVECQRFGITEVVGDQFSEGFAASEFRRHGITYVVSPRKTAECLLDALAILNTHRCQLLDSPKARRQWLGLRRDYASGGRPTVLESRKHDDLAVVTARGLVAVLGLGKQPEIKRRVMFAR